jgi:hypothetical protein
MHETLKTTLRSSLVIVFRYNEGLFDSATENVELVVIRKLLGEKAPKVIPLDVG